MAAIALTEVMGSAAEAHAEELASTSCCHRLTWAFCTENTQNVFSAGYPPGTRCGSSQRFHGLLNGFEDHFAAARRMEKEERSTGQ